MQTMGVLLSVAVALLGLAICLMMAYEAWALKTGRQPITGFVRNGLRGRPHLAYLAALAVGALAGHFFWH
jgi:hypothetical protein